MARKVDNVNAKQIELVVRVPAIFFPLQLSLNKSRTLAM